MNKTPSRPACTIKQLVAFGLALMTWSVAGAKGP